MRKIVFWNLTTFTIFLGHLFPSFTQTLPELFFRDLGDIFLPSSGKPRKKLMTGKRGLAFLGPQNSQNTTACFFQGSSFSFLKPLCASLFWGVLGMRI